MATTKPGDTGGTKHKTDLKAVRDERWRERIKEIKNRRPTDEKPTDTGNYEDYLSGDDRNAYLVIKNLFTEAGIPSLADKVYDYITKGYNEDTINILLQDTPEFKQRFPANEERKKAGLPVLDPRSYIQLENSYRQLMRQSGLPEGFYNTPDDFNQFISKDVSPTEVQSRVELASQATALASPSYRQALNDLYGIGPGELTAYFLDPDRALPLIQKQAAASAIGAEAYKRGLATDKNRLEEYAAAGISAQQAGQIYTTIAEQQAGFRQAASVFDESLKQEELEQAFFQQGGTSPGGETSSAKLTRLQSWQRARQGGQAGGAQQGLARRSR